MGWPSVTARRTVGIEIEATGKRKPKGQGAMTHYLRAVTAAPERYERSATATAEDATTTDGTAAPERYERSAIATAEDATTTDGTAAPERYERGAISAAEFLEATRRCARIWAGSPGASWR